MKTKITLEFAKHILETYGANSLHWPAQYRVDVEQFLKKELMNQAEALDQELAQQASIDLLLAKYKQATHSVYSDKEIDTLSNNILANLAEQEPKDKPAAFSFATLIESLFLHPARTGLALILIVSATALILSQTIRSEPDARLRSNPAIVEHWLWSEVNPELLDGQGDQANTETLSFGVDNSSEEEI